MIIEKIHLVKHCFDINYIDEIESGTVKCSLIGKNIPIPGFPKLFQTLLLPHIVIQEFTEDSFEGAVVNSLTIKKKAKDLEFKIAVKRVITSSNSPDNNITPPCTYRHEGDNSEAIVECYKIITELCEYAERYINGEQAQGKIEYE